MINRILILFFSLIIGGIVKGQDTIKLFTGNIIPIVIINMDSKNVYFNSWDNKEGKILSIQNSLISEIVFKDVKFDLEDSSSYYFFKHDSTELKYEKIESSQINKIKKKVGVSINILPTIDLAVDVDVAKKINIGIGKGIGYYYFGGKLYFSDQDKKWRKSLGLYYYNLAWIDSGACLNIPFSFELRSENGFNLKFEAGLLIGSSFIIPLPKIGLGVRF